MIRSSLNYNLSFAVHNLGFLDFQCIVWIFSVLYDDIGQRDWLNLNGASATILPLQVHELVIGLQHGEHPLPEFIIWRIPGSHKSTFCQGWPSWRWCWKSSSQPWTPPKPLNTAWHKSEQTHGDFQQSPCSVGQPHCFQRALLQRPWSTFVCGKEASCITNTFIQLNALHLTRGCIPTRMGGKPLKSVKRGAGGEFCTITPKAQQVTSWDADWMSGARHSEHKLLQFTIHLMTSIRAENYLNSNITIMLKILKTEGTKLWTDVVKCDWVRG